MTSINEDTSVPMVDEAMRLLIAAGDGLNNDVAAEFPKLSDGWGDRLSVRHPLADMLSRLVRSLIEAGFTLHDCAASERVGGVCVTPSTSRDGVIVTWTTHDILSLDGERHAENSGLHEVMNFALADALCLLGWDVEPYGQASAHIVRKRARRPDGSTP